MHDRQFKGGPTVVNFNELIYLFRTKMNDVLDYHHTDEVYAARDGNNIQFHIPHVPAEFAAKIENAMYEIMENEFSNDDFNFILKVDHTGRDYTIQLPLYIVNYLEGENDW